MKHPDFEAARDARRASDLRLTPTERLREAESLAVFEGPYPRQAKVALLCEALNRHGARYVVAGTVAGTLWGYVRATRDTDILIEATEENAGRVLGALNDLGFILTRDLEPKEIASRHVTMIGDLFRIDILTLAWSVRFEDAIATATIFDIDGTSVPTISLELLIKSKQTDRLQDKADVEELEILRRRLAGGGHAPPG